MWMVNYGSTWINFYKVEKNKSLKFVTPPTPKMFFYLLQRVFRLEGVKKNETIIVGFPGVIKKGRVLTCPTLDETLWRNINLSQRLAKLKLQPYIINDTDLNGHLIVKGKGVELVLSFGAGMGSSLYIDGLLIPNTELGHHPFSKNKTYSELLSHKTVLRSGKMIWLKNLKIALATLQKTINPDKIYLTGSLCYLIEKHKFAKHIKVVSNPEPSKRILKGLRLPG